MLNKLIITLISIVVAIVSIMNSSTPIVEGWNIGSMKYQTQRIVTDSNGKSTAVNGSSLLGPAGVSFISNPSFQAMMSPRFQNPQEGVAVRYNLPQERYRAAPRNPVAVADMATEGYCGSGTCNQNNGEAPRCGAGGTGGVPRINNAVPSDYSNGNFKEVNASIPASSTQVVNTLPLGTMSSIDASGNEEQIVMANQFMYANSRSRLRSQGCPIRGDLAIVNCNKPGWFTPSVTPALDLHPGALNVIAGSNNEQGQSLSMLLTASSGVPVPFGGISDPASVSINGTQYSGSTSQGGSTISIGALP